MCLIRNQALRVGVALIVCKQRQRKCVLPQNRQWIPNCLIIWAVGQPDHQQRSQHLLAGLLLQYSAEAFGMPFSRMKMVGNCLMESAAAVCNSAGTSPGLWRCSVIYYSLNNGLPADC